MRKLVCTVLLSVAASLLTAMAGADEVKGLAIAKERKARDAGWGDSESRTTMILRNANGQESPLDEFSGYSKTIVWLDQQHYRLHKAEYYDRKNALLKTLTLQDYKQYLDKYWRPHKLTMLNHQTGKSTDLLIHSISFNTGRTAADFDTNALQRVR